MLITEKPLEAEERHRIRAGFDRILEILDRAVPWRTGSDEPEVRQHWAWDLEQGLRFRSWLGVAPRGIFQQSAAGFSAEVNASKDPSRMRADIVSIRNDQQHDRSECY